MDELDLLINEIGINIQIFIGTETVDDPNYDSKSVSYLNPFPVKAIVSQVGFTSSQWRMPGIKAAKVMEVTMHKRHQGLVEKSRKITISGITYYGWKPSEGNNIQYKIMGNYLQLLVHTNEIE